MSTKYIRTYACSECGEKWRGRVDSKQAAIPTCPHCSNKIKPIGFDDEGKAPAYFGQTSASKAANIAYRMIERDYGLTDMNDNMRAGDIAAKLPPSPVADTMQQRGGFFGSGQPQQVSQGRESVMQMASAAKQQRLREGSVDPVVFAQQSMQKGPDVIQYARANPMGRAKLK